MRKWVSLLTTVCLITAMTGASFASPSIQVYIDGQKMQSEAKIIQSRTMVPFRAVFEGLGAEQILWDKETKTVTGIKDGTAVTLAIGNPVAFVNGQPETLEVGPAIVGSSTLVPLSFISQKMGYKVAWQGSVKTVQIMSVPYYEKVKDTLVGAKVFGEEENKPQKQETQSAQVKPDTATPTPSTPQIKPKQEEKLQISAGNVSVGAIKGAFAMQNINRNRFVLHFGNSGKMQISPLGSKQMIEGNYKISDKSIEIKSEILNGSFIMEEIKGKRTYYLLKSSGGSAFAMTAITEEQFMQAIKK